MGETLNVAKPRGKERLGAIQHLIVPRQLGTPEKNQKQVSANSTKDQGDGHLASLSIQGATNLLSHLSISP